MHHAASEITAPDTEHLPAYWLFHEAVARAQLAAWLPRGHRVLVDISGPRAPTAELAARAGHRVIRVMDDWPGVPASQRAAGARGAPRAKGAGDWTDERGTSEEGGASKAPGGERGNTTGSSG